MATRRWAGGPISRHPDGWWSCWACKQEYSIEVLSCTVSPWGIRKGPVDEHIWYTIMPSLHLAYVGSRGVNFGLSTAAISRESAICIWEIDVVCHLRIERYARQCEWDRWNPSDYQVTLNVRVLTTQYGEIVRETSTPRQKRRPIKAINVYGFSSVYLPIE